ncbi:MAG: hypothetical protein OK442_08370 [Thaumarchaeota archaeon]|nr:hypothetical protein [Nitrososphaerota archaeon]
MFSTKPRYFSRNLGLASPPGDNVHEFLVVWNHELGSLAKVLQVFSTHKAKVIVAHSQLEEGMVVGTFYCDTTKADETVEGMQKEIKELTFVRSVDAASAESSLFDKFLFPVTVWGRERVIIMRLSPLLNIERRLVEELGSAGSAIMFREGEGYAAETIVQYRTALGEVATGVLLGNVVDGLRATGWGLFEFKETKDGYEVTVRDAPTLATTTEPSRFLCGIVAGILETVFSVKMKVVESTIEPKSGRMFVRLSKTSDMKS